MRILFRLQRSSSITSRCRLTVERGNERRYEKGAIQSAAAQRGANDLRQDGALPVLGAQRMSVSGLVEALNQAALHLLTVPRPNRVWLTGLVKARAAWCRTPRGSGSAEPLHSAKREPSPPVQVR